MAENQKGPSDAVQKTANAAHAVHGAVKAGKAVAAAAKGAAVGGPYGAVAGALWENRRLVLKIVIAVAFILFLPILFVLMLPSIIFGGVDMSSPEVPILNNNTAILQNVTEADTAIRTLLQEDYDTVISKVQKEIEKLAEGTKYEVVDPFDERLLYNSSLVISQYCVKTNYQDISVADFKRAINSARSTNLFNYTRSTKQVEITVTNAEGKPETVTENVIVFTVEYYGEGYFRDTVFHLTDEQQQYAQEYAANLDLFLDDQFAADSNNTHQSIPGWTQDSPFDWTGEGFHSPFAGEDWQSHITSPFGYRLDPFTRQPSGHSGLDIGMPRGTPIHAAKDGVVVKAVQQNTGYGYHIILNHGNGYTTLYGHCNELLVREGDRVKAGDVIAKVGTTGRSTGYNLHFEVIKDGEPQDPLSFIS